MKLYDRVLFIGIALGLMLLMLHLIVQSIKTHDPEAMTLAVECPTGKVCSYRGKRIVGINSFPLERRIDVGVNMDITCVTERNHQFEAWDGNETDITSPERSE
jgi:hypothetical protein